MRKNILLHEYLDQPTHLDDIYKSLTLIQDKLLNEISSKQDTIEALEFKVNSLETFIFERNSQIKDLNNNLEISRKKSEGNRQVMAKLLNEMERLQQDIEWYKRTYERRSFLGYIKQKLYKSKSKN